MFLSFRNAITFSDPMGFGRVYAKVEGELSVHSFQQAIRDGRTTVTNGPWLDLHLEANGRSGEIGDRIDLTAPQRLTVIVSVSGVGADTVEIRTGAGVAASFDVPAEGGRFEAQVEIVEPTFVVAVATGPMSPDILGWYAYAHTSPIYVDVLGVRVARAEDALWCLDWLDELESLVRRGGRFDEDADSVTWSRSSTRHRGSPGAPTSGAAAWRSSATSRLASTTDVVRWCPGPAMRSARRCVRRSAMAATR